MKTVITHTDVDGVLSLSIFFKKFKHSGLRIFFSSNQKFKDTICSSIFREKDLDELYIFDFSGVRETLSIASTYKKVFWFDHHIWESNLTIPKNIKTFIRESKSATSIIAKYLNVESELVSLADEIDSGNTKSEDAVFLRNMIDAHKWKYGSSNLGSKLKNIAKNLAISKLEKFERSENIVKLMSDYSEYIRKIEKDIIEKSNFFEVDSLKVAVYETSFNISPNILADKLLKHPKAPFDVIALITHQNDVTRVEMRTHTDKDVLKIASFLGGGGHKRACGATADKNFKIEDFLKVVRSVKP